MDLPDLQLTVPGTAVAVRQALRDILPDRVFAAYSPDLAVNAEIVLAEVLNNIVEHAYSTTSGEITIALTRTAAGLRCCLSDHGAAMPGLQPPAGPSQTLGKVDDLPEGGFGWFLIRSLVQELAYQRVGGKNLLSFLLVDEPFPF